MTDTSVRSTKRDPLVAPGSVVAQPGPGTGDGTPGTRAVWDTLRANWHVVVAVVSMGLVGGWGISTPSLWRDETITWTAATRSFRELAGVVQHVDAVIAPYYLFMNVWISIFGDSHLSLRLPSLIAMIATAGLVAAVGGRLYRPLAGVIGALLFTSLPVVSRYAQEARPYALACFFAALATWALLRAWEAPSRRRWLLYGLACILTGWAHLLAFSIVAAHGLAVLILAVVLGRSGALWRAWVVVCGAATIAVMPLVVLGMRQQEQIGHMPLTSLRGLPDVLGRVVGGALLAGLLVGLGIVGAKKKWLELPTLAVVLLAIVPFSLLFITGMFRPLFHERYVVFVLIGWTLLAGVALARAHRFAAVGALVFVVFLGVPANRAVRSSGGHGDGGVDTAVERIRGQLREGDVIIIDLRHGWLRLSADYYFGTGPRPRDAMVAATPQQTNSYLARECSEPEACLADAKRVWVLCVNDAQTASSCPYPELAVVIRKSYQLTSVDLFDTMKVDLYS